MHEHTFIEAIINKIPVEDKDKIIGLDIELGELVGIEVEHLKEHLFEHTGWNVEINPVESEILCRQCSYGGRARINERLHDMVIFSCPKCGSFDIDVLKGENIKIIKVSYSE